ncbi:WXG100 family type VII secretion target [Amycolatopsis sp. WAC 04197]|uniref:WXG100 family type VII secretion target n=1 Tax=Amycolatopsis sp. WAC 04197 TaxID=2203199 RepID=UPI000F779FE5|nr:WXG100 family type VII secretion target [Amycolatopsis sp. WAC 04197]RSN39929.1 WXG100 family type VII secretion target [Amycolatopsis sp. WAC 04197]
MSDLITYDYDVIDQCLTMMKNKALEIEGQTTDLENDVKRIMVGWMGSTAEAYDAKCQRMKGNLITSREQLDSLRSALQAGAQGMQEQDARGARGL